MGVLQRVTSDAQCRNVPLDLQKQIESHEQDPIHNKQMQEHQMEGVCNCGTVSFSISGSLPGMYQCHCTLCQKQSGAGSNASTIVPLNTFRWLSGEESIKKWKKTTGFPSYFCEGCGSPVPNPVGSDYMWIPVGLIGDAYTNIVAHLWLSSKSDWDQPQKAIRNYEGMPEDTEEFIRFLQSETNI